MSDHVEKNPACGNYCNWAFIPEAGCDLHDCKVHDTVLIGETHDEREVWQCRRCNHIYITEPPPDEDDWCRMRQKREKMKSKIDWPTELRETTVELAEHEVLLSFVDDIDAELFSEWWNSTGFDLFKVYGEKEKADRE